MPTFWPTWTKSGWPFLIRLNHWGSVRLIHTFLPKLPKRCENETVWLTQAQMAELFNSTRNNVTLHIKNIFHEHELDANSVCKESLLTANDGKKYKKNAGSFESAL